MTTDRDAAAGRYAEQEFRRGSFNRPPDLTVQAAFRAGWDAAMEWRPIETAPKAEVILLWPAPYVGWNGIVGHWAAAHQQWNGQNWDGWLNPTHWMPLPLPPASTGEGA